MKIIRTELDGVVIIEPKIFNDERGYFFESYSQKEFEIKVCKTTFVQDNESLSKYGVLRGLHYQLPPYAQSKLIRVTEGKVLDVVVDVQRSSSNFGKYLAFELSAENHRQLFIPKGFAHGFVVLSETAIFQYKCDNYYAPQAEGAIAYNDPTLNIDWKIPFEHVLISEKDKKHPFLDEAIVFD